MKKFDGSYKYLKDMYNDDYFPDFLVDKLKVIMEELVAFLEPETHTLAEVQLKLDELIEKTNELQEEFYDNDSEIETAARDSIGQTVEDILIYFEIDIDIETAIGAREW